MKFTGICLVTPSVPALASFYARVFDCQGQGDDTHMEFNIGGLGLAIFSVGGMEEMAPGSMNGAGWGGVTIMFEVADADAECDRLLALGVEMVKPPQTYPWGARSVWFRDPDGNVIDLFARAA